LIIEPKIEVNCYTMQSLGLKVYRYGALVAVHVQVAGLAVDLGWTFWGAPITKDPASRTDGRDGR
jgi:hypothetical protein